MKSTALVFTCVAALALAGASMAQAPATAPAPGARSGPAKALDRIRDIVSRQPRTQQELQTMLKVELPKVLAVLAEMETKYPKAEQLQEARAMGLRVAGLLAERNEDPKMAAQAGRIAKRILASNPSPEARLFADFNLVMLKIRPIGADDKPSPQAAKLIHTFSGRAWEDPTARKYGIRSIPALWVVGKDGKIANTGARGRLERVLDKALAPAPTTQPVKRRAN